MSEGRGAAHGAPSVVLGRDHLVPALTQEATWSTTITTSTTATTTSDPAEGSCLVAS